MAWTDAARAASAAVRRAHARGKVTPSGKKARPMQWYHGVRNAALKGRYVQPRAYIPTDPSRAFATSRFTEARGYSGAKLYPGKSRVYKVKFSAGPREMKRFDIPAWAYTRKAVAMRGHFGKTIEASARVHLRAVSMPRAKGRAARGRY